jgi:hypothetical protein
MKYLFITTFALLLFTIIGTSFSKVKAEELEFNSSGGIPGIISPLEIVNYDKYYELRQLLPIIFPSFRIDPPIIDDHIQISFFIKNPVLAKEDFESWLTLNAFNYLPQEYFSITVGSLFDIDEDGDIDPFDIRIYPTTDSANIFHFTYLTKQANIQK